MALGQHLSEFIYRPMCVFVCVYTQMLFHTCTFLCMEYYLDSLGHLKHSIVYNGYSTHRVDLLHESRQVVVAMSNSAGCTLLREASVVMGRGRNGHA